MTATHEVSGAARKLIDQTNFEI